MTAHGEHPHHRPRDGAQAVAWFDGSAPVRPEDLRGRWRGQEVRTGHVLNGVLARLGWYGKEFVDEETVHPLVFRDAGGLFRVDPTFLPLRGLPAAARVVRTAPTWAVGPSVLRVRATTRPQARLRLMEHRGVVTATMVYDRLPIQDHFRQVDADTVLGAMDMRGSPDPFFFLLRRDTTR